MNGIDLKGILRTKEVLGEMDDLVDVLEDTPKEPEGETEQVSTGGVSCDMNTQSIFEYERESTHILNPKPIDEPTDKGTESEAEEAAKTSWMSMKPSRRVKTLEKSPIYKWIKLMWIHEIMVLQAPKIAEWLKKKATTEARLDIAEMGHVFQAIMKQFVLWKKTENCSGQNGFQVFEDWSVQTGYCTIYGRGVRSFPKDCVDLLLKALQAVTQEYYLSQSTTSMSTSSTTVITGGASADAPLCERSPASRGTKKAATKKSVAFEGGEEIEEEDEEHCYSSDPNSGDSGYTVQQKLKKARKKKMVVKRIEDKMTTSAGTSKEGSGKRKQTTLTKQTGRKKSKSNVDTSDEDQLKERTWEQGFNDMLDEASEKSNIGRGTGTICSNISVARDDGSLTFKSEGDVGQTVLELKSYPFGKCLGKEKKDWWRVSNFRGQYVIGKKNKHIRILMEQLKEAIVKDMKERNDVTVEVKYNEWKS